MPGLVMTVLMMLTVAYFAHKNNWGADIKFEWSRVGKAMLRARWSSSCFRLAVWGLASPASNPVVATSIAIVVLLFVADWMFKFEAGAADHDAGAADRRHGDRHLHADRGRGRRVDLGAVPRAGLVPHAVAAAC